MTKLPFIVDITDKMNNLSLDLFHPAIFERVRYCNDSLGQMGEFWNFGSNYNIFELSFSFQNHEDAMLFRLKFG
jgi:hypothetical protein